MESLDLVGWLRGTVLARSPGQTISPMHALQAMYARAILEAAGKTGAGKTCTHYVRVTLICIRSYNNCVSPLNIIRNLGFVAWLKCVVLGLEPGSWSRAWHWNHTPRGRQICAGFVCLCLLASKVELSPETNRSQWILLLVLPSDSESGKNVCRKAILGH